MAQTDLTDEMRVKVLEGRIEIIMESADYGQFIACKMTRGKGMKIALIICVICAVCIWALCRAAGQEDEKSGRK